LTSWQMLARDVGDAFAYAAKDFVGTMVAAIDLRSPSDWLLDSQTVRLERVPAARQRRGGDTPNGGGLDARSNSVTPAKQAIAGAMKGAR
jgi:hypothetical protein